MALSRSSSRPYTNADGPGGRTVDYGPRGPSRPDYGDSGYMNDYGAQIPANRGGRPIYTPSPQKHPDYFVQETPEQAQAWQQGNDMRNATQRTAYGADPGMSAARGAGDVRGYIQAMQAMKAQGQEQRFIDQGGTAETYRDRFNPNNNWPVPRSPSGNYQYGPGRPGPTPPNVAGGGAPPQGGGGGRGGLIEGYQPGPAPSHAMSTGQGATGMGYGAMGGGFDPRQVMQALQGQMQGGGGGGPMGGTYIGRTDGGGYGPGVAGDPNRYFGGGMGTGMAEAQGRQPIGYPTNPGSGGRQPLPQPPQGPPQDPRMPRQSPWGAGGGFNPYMPPQWSQQGGYSPFDMGGMQAPYDVGGGMGRFYPQGGGGYGPQQGWY